MAQAQNVLRGREGELGDLHDLLGTAAKGRLSAALVEGEAGIGKTRLLEEVLEEAGRRGFHVVYGRSEELEQRRPFGALVDALGCTRTSTDERRAMVASLVTGEGSTPIGVDTDAGTQHRVVEALVELIEEEALAAPVAMAIEDLQYADASTLLAFRALELRLAQHPVALLGSMRPVPRSRELEVLLDRLVRGGAVHLLLSPLNGRAVRDLVHDLLGGDPGESLIEGVAGAAGNPLFVIELVQALEQEGTIAVVDDRYELAEAAFPPSLRLTILRRIGFLPPQTLDGLRACTVLGSSFSIADLATTTGRAAGDVFRDLHPAFQAGVLAETGSARSRFRHELIRNAIYEDMPESLRVVLHADAARKLADAGAPALKVAEQNVRARDPEAVSWLVRAARETAPGSPAAAADLLERAIEIAQPTQIDDLLRERGSALFWAGRVDEAAAVLRGVLERRPDESDARAALAQVLMAEGRPQDALQELGAARAAPKLPPEARARIQAWAGHAKLHVGDIDGAVEDAEAALATADKARDPTTACIASCCLTMAPNLRGRFADAVPFGERAVALGDQSPGREAHRFHLGVFQGMSLIDVDRLADGVAALRRGQRISEEIGARWSLPIYEGGLVVASYFSGEWDDALAHGETCENLMAESGTRHGMVWFNAIRGLISLHRDDVRAASSWVDEAERELAQTGPQVHFDWAMWARGLLHEATGSLGEAYDALARAWELCSAMGLTCELPVLGPDLVRLALGVGDQERTGEVVSALHEIAVHEEAPWVVGSALRTRALVTPDVAAWQAAVDAYRLSPRLLDRAIVLEEAGGALGRSGQKQEGAALLEESLDLYEKLDAVRDISRAEAALRDLGFKRGPRGGRRRPASGWGSLTNTEQRVVPLVAEGLSNRQIADRLFVSPRTIQTHIGHIFAKLSVSSRVEIASQAAQRAANAE